MKNKTNLFFVLLLALSVTSIAQTVINMERQGNSFYVPCKVNGVPMKMIFDTGAEEVSMSLSEAIFMMKNGYLSNEDFGETAYYGVASGEVVEGMTVNLREIEVGGIKIRNVKASIIKSMSAPLLFGQSAIQKLGPIQISGNKLTILNGKGVKNDKDYYLEAYQFNEAEEFDKAISSCKNGLLVASSNDNKALLYYELANAYHGKGDLANAAESYKTSLTYKLISNTAYNLGVAYFEAGKLDLAYSAFKQSLQIKDINSENDKDGTAACYSYMAEIDRKSGRIYDAEKNAKKSIELRPYSQTFFTLGEIYVSKDDYKNAVLYFEAGTAFEPERASNISYYSRMGGYCLFYLAEHQEYIGKGLVFLEKALKIWDNRVAKYGRSYFSNVGRDFFQNQKLIKDAYYSALPLSYFYYLVEEKELSKQYLKKAIEIRGKDLQADNMEKEIAKGLNYSN